MRQTTIGISRFLTSFHSPGLILTIGNVVYGTSQWGIIVIIARDTGSRHLGYFAYALAITAPIILLLNFQLASIEATDTSPDFSFAAYFGTRLLTSLCSVTLISVYADTGQLPVTERLVIIAVAVAKSIDAISDIIYGLMLRRGLTSYIAIGMVANGLLSVGFVGIAILLFHSIVAAAAGSAIGSLVSCTLLNARNAVRMVSVAVVRNWWNRRPRLVWTRLVGLARTGSPLGLVMFLISLNASAPIYVLEQSSNRASVGLYGALLYPTVALGTVLHSFGNARLVSLAKAYSNSDTSRFIKLLIELMLLAIGLGMLLIATVLLYGRQLIFIIYGSGFTISDGAFTVLSLGTAIGLLGSCLGFAMTSSRHFAIQIPVFAAVAGTTFATAVLLVPHMGILGAAWAVLVGTLVQVLLSSLVVLWALRSR